MSPENTPAREPEMPVDPSKYSSYIHQNRELARYSTISGGDFSHANGDRVTTYYYGSGTSKDEKDIEQKITEVIIEILSLEKHETPEQQKSQEEVEEALNNYFAGPTMSKLKRLNTRITQYTSLHKNIGDDQKRSETFQTLKDYIGSEDKELSKELLELATEYRDELKNQSKGGGHSGDNIQREQPSKT